MHFLFPPLLRILAIAPLLLVTSVRAGSDMVELQARFIYASEAQVKTALAAAGISGSATAPLSPEQFEIVRSKLKEAGTNSFSDPRTVTRSGKKAIINSVREVRYPTEYAPSEREPGKFIPTSFEARNAGVTIEFTPTIGPTGESDGLKIDAEVTNFLGFIDFSGAKPARPNGEAPVLEELLKAPLTEGGFWLPIFESFTAKTEVEIRSGQTILIGGTMAVEPINSPKGQPAPRVTSPGRQIFVFITATNVAAR